MKNDSKNIDFPMRLVRFLALAGLASRRKSEELIVQGDISVNGEIIRKPAFKVSDSDKVLFAGKELQLAERVYIMLNKPPGYLCSASDPHAEKTIFDLVKIPGRRLFSVGRLDLHSEGLLILTDDGSLAEKLTHPRYQIRKRYFVRTQKFLSPEDIMKMEQGLVDEGEKLRAEKVTHCHKNEYLFTLTEGKKREIRRLVSAVAGKVLQLKRIAIGKLELGDLPLGQWRELTSEEIDAASENN